jgi:Domain of unknown function (DUF6265)
LKFSSIVSVWVFGFSNLFLSLSANAVEPPPAGKVADLAWMSGHYEGVVGKDGAVVEENWLQPKAGSIGSLVRNTKSGTTAIMEIIVVEEENNSLVLHLQQWKPGYKPVYETPLLMRLSELGKNRVMFEAVGEGAFKKLGYRREGSKFIITVVTANGQFEVPLDAGASAAAK